MNFLVFWSICIDSFFAHFKNGTKYLTMRTAQKFIPLMRFFAAELDFVKLSCLSKVFFLIYSSSLLVWYCQLPVFQGTCSFPFLKTFLCILDLVVLFLSLFLFSHFSLSTWHIFNAEFHSYILAAYSYYLYKGLQSFFIFANTFILFMYLKWLIFTWFCKFVAPWTFSKYIVMWHYCHNE